MDKEKFRALVVEYQCSHKCMGHAGNKGGCCTLDQRDFIIGPIRDADDFLARLSKHLGRPVARAEALIEYDEGAELFPELATWRDPANFPALRILADEPRKPCRYYDVSHGMCTIYPVRPETCGKYECAWLKGVIQQLC
jgi:Fe-S-cluster containining protein